MREVLLSVPRKVRRLASFTLIELLTVIVIIGILAALTIAAGSAVLQTAARDRARSEIKAMETALESYKTDNGAYPQYDFSGGTTSYVSASPTTANSYYQLSSELLYQSLTGQVNYSTMVTGAKAYMTFKPSQLGNVTVAAGNTYIEDPFANSYGYSTGTNSAGTPTDIPYNGVGFFDLWSTAGNTTGVTNSWINNWSGS